MDSIEGVERINVQQGVAAVAGHGGAEEADAASTGRPAFDTAAPGTVASSRPAPELAPAIPLNKGEVFEGTVEHLRHGLALIRLSDGQALEAKMDAGVKLAAGDSMLFEVKSNKGHLLAIRPLALESAQNPTLLKALQAAGLPPSPRNVSMVNTMMQNQMPIDKSSLQQMARLAIHYPQANVKELVQMKNLGITVQAENIQQFEQFKSGENSLQQQLSVVMESFSELSKSGMETFSSSPREMVTFQQQLLHLFDEGQDLPANRATVGEVLSQGQLQALGEQLRQLTGSELANPNLEPREMLQLIQNSLLKQEGLDPEALNPELLRQLFSGKEYQALLRGVMEGQWLIRPEEVALEHQMGKLYERVSRQMQGLEHLLQDRDMSSGLLQNTSAVGRNLDFMNQINQIFSYIQIPLKLANQNARGDLYVYANKKNLGDPERELSALLHLDLDHLGSTDVHVKMLGSQVKADFYLPDRQSIRLVENHAGELVRRLGEKGFQSTIQVEQHQEKIDFVEEFLEKEKHVGKLRRYSFDVKA